MVGTTLGHYRLESKLGEGGMGVVYKATDTCLGRHVAVKLLREPFLADAERLARLKREARALASLNNPNIAAIHGLEQDNGQQFLVLEYVPGETLADRIARGPLPLQDALSAARHVADGLEAAHAKGIIHRDLKPGNIKIGDDGCVKVLDFGLAKAVEPTATSDTAETITAHSGATEPGMIVGTVPYMSPEQAAGKPMDSRTDIWSFGCVLYEMLSGKRAFTGSSTTEVLASILQSEPDWGALPEGVPENVQCLLRRCLRKDPRTRLRDIGDARIELDDTLAGRVQPAAPPPRSIRTPVAAAAAAGVLVGLALAGTWAWNRVAAAGPPSVVRFAFDLPQGQAFRPTWNPNLAFSPTSETLAYSISGPPSTTYLRRLDELDSKPLASAPGMGIPVFSPDGRYLLGMDTANLMLKKVALSGGAPVPFASYDMAFRGDWAPDNYYYWTSHYFGPVIRTPGSGGKEERVTELDLDKQERTHRHPQMLPDAKTLIFTVSTGGIESFDDASIQAYNLQTKSRKILVQGGFFPLYSRSGHILYARAGNVYAVPFDASRIEVTGPPVKVADGVFMSTNAGSAYFALSRTGALAYAVGQAEGGQRSAVWVDRDGKAAPLPLPQRSYLFPRVSPDGKQLAIEVEGTNHDLYLYDFARGVMSKMTTDGMSHSPVWTSDGKYLGYRSWKEGTMTMWRMPADRSGPEERLTPVGTRQGLSAFSPDGRYAVFNSMEPGMRSDIWFVSLDGERKPQPLIRTRFAEGSARFSPDGKWVVYCSAESGRAEVYVQPWPGPGPKIQISSDGGTDPIWSRDGKEIFYRNEDKMMVVSVSAGSAFRAATPKLLWEGRYSHGMSSSCGMPGATASNYDVTADGRRFLMIRDADQGAMSTRVVVVLNFVEELKRLFAEQKSGKV